MVSKEADKQTSVWNAPYSVPLRFVKSQTVFFDYEKYSIGFSRNYTFPTISAIPTISASKSEREVEESLISSTKQKQVLLFISLIGVALVSLVYLISSCILMITIVVMEYSSKN